VIVFTFLLSEIVFSDGGSAEDSRPSAPCTQQVGTFSKGPEIIENNFFTACEILAPLFVCSQQKLEKCSFLFYFAFLKLPHNIFLA
jgi:hypothetical protein